MKEILKNAEEKMNKTLAKLSQEYTTIRAGRANPAVLDKIMIDYYDTQTPINQLAAISVAEARILVISPWDASSLKAIERGIQQSDLGINPTSDGKVIRIVFPQLTEERRKDLVKQIHKMGEEAKVAIRNIRRESMERLKQLKKEASYSEDEIKDAENQLQRIVDRKCKETDSISSEKENEVMAI